jgi:hypothetical protein
MTQSLLSEVLEPTIVAAFVSGVISLIGLSLSAFVALRTNDRQIQIENITKERAKWRDKIRKMSIQAHQAWASGNTEKIKEIRLNFTLNLNPFHGEDAAILESIDKLSGKKDDLEIEEFSDRVSLLLKHDWERAKFEAKSWNARFFCCQPTRVSYSEFLQLKRQGFPRPWFRTPKLP